MLNMGKETRKTVKRQKAGHINSGVAILYVQLYTSKLNSTLVAGPLFNKHSA
jgi:hypothetical protein